MHTGPDELFGKSGDFFGALWHFVVSRVAAVGSIHNKVLLYSASSHRKRGIWSIGHFGTTRNNDVYTKKNKPYTWHSCFQIGGLSPKDKHTHQMGLRSECQRQPDELMKAKTRTGEERARIWNWGKSQPKIPPMKQLQDRIPSLWLGYVHLFPWGRVQDCERRSKMAQRSSDTLALRRHLCCPSFALRAWARKCRARGWGSVGVGQEFSCFRPVSLVSSVRLMKLAWPRFLLRT